MTIINSSIDDGVNVMNLAIILAVSEYREKPLPGCILDGDLIKLLLNETGKFDEIIFLNGKNTDSTNVKEELTKFVASSQGKVFNEIFFYYTGHGDFRDSEFYFILSDFDQANYRQTTLSNSELDNLIKQLNPILTIKIIDACNSGVTYIKDNDSLCKYLDESKRSFQFCYFMFSSMTDQSSYQDKAISDFTKSFIDSIIKYPSGEVRYKHIIDFMSDEFENNARQIPFFVTQANFTEIFCDVNQKVKNLLSDRMKRGMNVLLGNEDAKSQSLIDMIIKDSQNHCSKEEILERIIHLKTFIENYIYSSELADLYNIESEFESDYTSITSQYRHSIGKWLKDNSQDYFAEVSYRDEIEGLDKMSAIERLSANSSILLGGNKKYKTRTVLSGFDLTVEVPYKVVSIKSNPKYLNLDFCAASIIFVFSQVNVRFFYYFSNYKMKDWENYYHSHSSELQTFEVGLKNLDVIEEFIANLQDKFTSFVLEPLKAKYLLSTDLDSAKLSDDPNPD